METATLNQSDRSVVGQLGLLQAVTMLRDDLDEAKETRRKERASREDIA